MVDLFCRQFGVRAAVSAAFLLVFVSVSPAQDGRKPDKPGQFDFYVLALTWSPSYCASAKERRPSRLPKPQCGGRPYSFVVHGLWPQYEHGFPSYCQHPAPRIDRALVDTMLDLMPSPQLVFHEWNRHGTCSGMTAKAYFEAVRKARAAVKIPSAYLQLAEPETVAPADVAAAFMQANPGLTAKAFAVACDKKRLTEVRVCLNKDFSFRDCAAVARRACRRDKVAMPAVRGG
jgi:ribonuclease T2